ncbi:MAG: UDP-N-acetylmuramoyl-L-alanyl-D-glutamate--2,6-diaminopimelate ligase [Bacteroidetes bacterium GWE2_29_8]|nr:MAG: UDP-N-acetylmuramoyl-L-alanyl-D-glutamate--2,6-diaminopimelate ligase [Bacteroidetes bacterium GWE2_29_8]OFY15629.1 MAG: UDP-N-acetylmuramoyl-L-alanyl-D-glutamate--2,6-diaminopimelate ligase [Bacteroidetes bacterium GWF2_29_10]
MKQLDQVLIDVEVIEKINYDNCLISKLSFNSRDLLDNGIFFAIRGTNVDGHDYIDQAIANQAKVIVLEKLPLQLNENIIYVVVRDSNHALGIIAANFNDNPSDKIKVIGITGTNGKTTTATLLYKLLSSLGYNVGLLSTVAVYVNKEEFQATHTTPDQITLQGYLNLMVSKGCQYCIMEVSSHSIIQKRIDGISFFGGVFTNITHDHLDYHKTFENYINAKKLFFDNLPSTAFALSNKDDRNGNLMLQNTKAKKYLYSLNNIADFKFRIVENTIEGMQINVENKELYTQLCGVFNAYNLLTVYSVASIIGEETEKMLTILSILGSVKGRFEKIEGSENKKGIIDYAHTPDALENVLETINITKNDSQNIITIIGCGGDRDKGKRPEMAKIACEKSYKTIITSDNPRFENPEDIIKDMLEGIKKYTFDNKYIVISDRREAIKTACLIAKPNDIILVAGKGHETYQDVKGIKSHFDDKEILTEFINL